MKTHNFYNYYIEHSDTITSLCWNPNNNNEFITSSLDSTVIKWRIKENEIQVSKKLSSPCLYCCYNYENEEISIVTQDGCLIFWNTQDNVYTNISTKTLPKILSWNPKYTDYLLIGSKDGVLLFNKTNKVISKFPNLPAEAVEHLEWNKLSPEYALIQYASGLVCVCDINTDIANILCKYEKMNANMRFVSWAYWDSGTFYMVNRTNGIISQFSISQTTPIRSFTIMSVATYSMKSRISHLLLIAYSNGSIVLYDEISKDILYQSEPSHQNAIIKMKACPKHCNILATLSIDGYIKIWNNDNNKCENTLSYLDGEIYSFDWHPANDVLFTGGIGKVLKWDYKNEKIIDKIPIEDLTETKIINISFSNQIPYNCCVFGDDHQYYLLSPDLSSVSFSLKSKLLLFDWNIYESGFILASSANQLTLYNNSYNKSKEHVFQHKSTVTSICISHLVQNLCASGDAAGYISLWNLKEDVIGYWKGHEGIITGLLFCSQYPNLLYSCSEDKTVKVWDCLVSKCLKEISFQFPVYEISIHDEQPFLFTVNSGDLVLRTFLLEGLAARAKSNILNDQPEQRIRKDAYDIQHGIAISNYAKAVPILSGEKIIELYEKIHVDPPLSYLEMFYKVFLFFYPLHGIKNLFELLASCQFNSAPPTNLKIPNLAFLGESCLKRTDLLIRQKVLKSNEHLQLQKKRNIQRSLCLLGDIKGYCNYLISNNDYEGAIAIAPSISMEYWEELMKKYESKLENEGNDDVLLVYECLDENQKISEYYKDRNNFEECYLNETMKNQMEDGKRKTPSIPIRNNLIDPISPNRSENNKCSILNPCIENLISELADSYYINGDTLLAACCYASNSDIYGVTNTLIRGNEIELSYYLFLSFKIKVPVYLKRMLVMRFESLKLVRLVEMFIADLDEEDPFFIQMYPFYFNCTNPKPIKFHSTLSVAEYKKQANAMHASGDYFSAMFNYIFGKETNNGLLVALMYIKQQFDNPVWNFSEIEGQLDSISFIYLNKNVDEKNKNELLMYYSFIGGIKAVWRHYTPIIHYLFKNAMLLESKNSYSKLPMNHYDIYRFEINYFSHCSKEALEMLKEDINNDIQLTNDNKKNLIDIIHTKISNTPIYYISPYECISFGSNIPYGYPIESNPVSIISNKKIRDEKFELEDNNSAISLSEAIMWQRVNPFSPLNSGSRINPY